MNQDAVLLMDVGGRLVVELNDAGDRGWGRFVRGASSAATRVVPAGAVRLRRRGHDQLLHEDGQRIPPTPRRRAAGGADHRPAGGVLRRELLRALQLHAQVPARRQRLGHRVHHHAATTTPRGFELADRRAAARLHPLRLQRTDCIEPSTRRSAPLRPSTRRSSATTGASCWSAADVEQALSSYFQQPSSTWRAPGLPRASAWAGRTTSSSSTRAASAGHHLRGAAHTR